MSATAGVAASAEQYTTIPANVRKRCNILPQNVTLEPF